MAGPGNTRCPYIHSGFSPDSGRLIDRPPELGADAAITLDPVLGPGGQPAVVPMLTNSVPEAADAIQQAYSTEQQATIVTR